MNADQSLAFSEEYEYLPRLDDPGMVYVYALVVSSDQQEAFLTLLLQKCGSKEVPKAISQSELIRELLISLVKQKQLAVPQPRERNLNLISSWLKAAGIPHTGPCLAF